MSEEKELPSITSDANAELILELNDAFEEAEKLLKEVENSGETFYASVTNELRYAGRHHLNAVTSKSKQTDELQKAIKHCHRATYDASDALVIYHLEYISRFEIDYEKISLLDSIPYWKDYLLKAEEAQNFIVSNVNHQEEQHKNSEKCLELSIDLKRISNDLRVIRPELNKKIQERVDQRFRWMVTISIAFLATLVTILSLFT
jgi:N-methylhydantoinase A/oxoprolinase/acetone carboxylase beta subunit